MAKLVTFLTFCVAASVAQQLASETCDASRRTVDVEMTNANAILGGIFDIRRRGTDGYGCGQPSLATMQMYEAARWTISKLNSGSTFNNGIRLGMKAYDSCSSEEQTIAAAYKFYPQSSSRASYCTNSPTQINLGFLGPTSSWTSLAIAGLIKKFPAPAVSPRSGASSLSDTNLYPTFFRTSPSSAALARALMAILERLQWKRVVLVYTEDAYAMDGLKMILNYALSSDKCVIQAVKVYTNETSSQMQNRLSVLQGYDVNGGIAWTPTESTGAVLNALNLLRGNIGHIQWIFTALDITQTYTEELAKGVMVVKPGSSDITEFRDYFLGINENSPPGENPWFSEWYMTNYKCQLPGANYGIYATYGACPNRDINTRQSAYVQEAYVEATIKAVYAYAAALHEAWQSSCFGARGICNSLRNMNSETFVQTLRNVRYTFTAADGMANLVDKTVAFDSNGDFETSEYTIFNYVNNRFVNVGSYSNGNLNLDVSGITFYDSNRLNTIPAPTSPCPAGGCQNCLYPNTDYSYTFIPGDIIIGSILSQSDSGSDAFTCGSTMPIGAEAMLAMRYALREFRNILGENVLNGVSLGALVVDDCLDKYIASTFLEDLLKRRKPFTDASGGTIDTEFLRSFINMRSSVTALDTSIYLGNFKLPEMEVSATSRRLGNKMHYPYFNRVIPSGDEMSSAIVNILKRFGWSYIQVVYESDEYGHEKMMTLKEHASKSQICVAGAYSTNQNPSDIVDKLRSSSDAKAVVIFVEPGSLRSLMTAMRAKGSVDEFVLILVLWAGDFDLVADYPDVAAGSITIRQSSRVMNGFNEYLAEFITPSLDKVKQDPVLSRLYEAKFNCFLNAGSRGGFNQACTSQTLRYNGAYSPFMIHAVFSMAQALHNTLSEVCGSSYNGLCNAFRNTDRVSEVLLQKLRNISYFNTQTSSMFNLLDGEGVTDFDIYNYRSGQGFVNVGKYSVLQKRITEMQDGNIFSLGGQASAVISRCTHGCLQCFQYTQQPFLYLPGDLMLGGLFSVSNPGDQGPFVCGSVRTTNGFQYTAAMHYAIDMVNQNRAPVSLNGVRLGGLAMDHCNNPDRPFSLLSSIYAGLMDNSLQMGGMEPSRYQNALARKITAWLTDNTASTHEAGEFLNPYSIPIVSPSATSSTLMNISSFYRTIQGDDTIAMAMIKTAKSLNLPYVQVVHSASTYGRGGLSATRAAAQQEGICVTFSIEMSSSMSANDVLNKIASNPTDVVILYLGTSDMTSLLRAKASRTDTATSSIVFISPEPFTQVVQAEGGVSARNMLSIQLNTPSLSDFIAYLNNKVIIGYPENPYFDEFYMAINQCNLPGYYTYPSDCSSSLIPFNTNGGRFTLSNFLSSTINAVYSATFALDLTLKQLCGEEYDGVCQEFRNAADLNIRLVENLRQTSFNNFGSGFRFFNREGNSKYNILRFTGSVYETVGNYEGAAIQLNDNLVADYSNVESLCTSPCLECVQTGLNFSYIPGDILLGGIFDVHQKNLNPFSCGNINTLHGFQLLEAFHYALSQVNAKEGMFANILRGTTLGGVGLDSCESAIRTGYLVSNIHNGLTTLAKNGYTVNPDDIDLYLGGYSSDSSLYLARILADIKVPQISYAASSTALLDRYRYPYFYRTVPADDKQARAMLTFLDKNDIRYVQVLYTQSNYGEFGAAAFERLAPDMRICVGQMVRFPDNGTVSKESSNDVVTQLLSKPVANTIIVFAGTGYINALLKAVKRNPAAIGKFRFIGSETWGNNEDAILEVEEIATGSITFNLETTNLRVYDAYLSGKTPANSQDNPWFGEYYEEIQNCYLTISDGSYPKQCPQTPENIISSIRYKQDPGVLHVINSVYSAAFAIDATLKQLCGVNYTTVCEAYKNAPNTRDIILDRLQEVSFEDPSDEDFRFTDRRDGNKGYDIYNLEFIPVQGYVYKKVGAYTGEGELTSSYVADYDGSCIRPDACTECPSIRNVGVRYAIDEPAAPGEAALTVIGVFDVHEQGTDSYRCGAIRGDGIKQFMAFFYAMQRIVARDFRLNIRSVAIDTCSNSLRTGQDIYNLLNGRGLCNSEFANPTFVGLENTVGVVVSGNENTMGVARVLDPFQVSYISPSANSIVFNSTEMYPYFARTTAPRGYILRGVAAILKALGYDYVVAVSSTWRFDDGGYDNFLSVSGGKTCVRSAFNLPTNPTIEDANEAIIQLREAQGSNVIVLFTTMEDTMLILRAAKELNVLDKFFWVFTDTGAIEWVFPAGYKFSGMILKPRQGIVRDYIAFAESMKYIEGNPDLNDKSVPKSWYEDYYQAHFQCRLTDAAFPATQFPPCTKKENFTGSFAPTMDRFTLSTIAAAYAMVKGVVDTCGGQSLDVCLPAINTDRDRLFRNILNISAVPLRDKLSIETSTNSEFNLRFNSERFWDAGYEVLLWNYPDGSHKMADWQGDSLTNINNTLTTSFKSSCPKDADCGCARPQTGGTSPQVQGPLFTEPRNYYLYGNDGTMIHDWPVWAIAVAVLTSIGIIVTVLVALILLFTYPIRGGTTILGFMVILGILGIYLINFAFFMPASFSTCATRRFCMGVIYMIVFSALLVKAVDNWRYGDMDWNEQKKYRKITSACSLFMIAVGIVLIQAIIPIEWLILIAPTASKMVDSSVHDYWWCDPVEMYDIGLVLSFIFVMFILLVTAIFSAMSWDSEVNNRESRWILISCICTAGCFLVWMIVTTNAGPTYRDPTVAIANFVNATALLLCIPIRKLVLLIAYKRAGDEDEEPYENIYSHTSNGYPNSAFDPDFDLQRQDSKQDSEVGF